MCNLYSNSLSILFILLNIHRVGGGLALAWFVHKVCSCGKTARVAKSLTHLIASFCPSAPPSFLLFCPLLSVQTFYPHAHSHMEELLFFVFVSATFYICQLKKKKKAPVPLWISLQLPRITCGLTQKKLFPKILKFVASTLSHYKGTL